MDEEGLKDIVVEDLSPQQYYELISTIINQNLEGHKPAAPVYGEVVISFVLDNNGRLISVPKVSKGEDKVLSELVIKSIKESTPFPAFPKSIDKKQEAFQIAISYE